MAEPTPPPIQVQVPAPLQWQVGDGNLPDGTKVCVLILTQGVLTSQVVLTPDDTEQLGRGLIQQAAQARSSLIIPTGVQLPKLNGGH